MDELEISSEASKRRTFNDYSVRKYSASALEVGSPVMGEDIVCSCLKKQALWHRSNDSM